MWFRILIGMLPLIFYTLPGAFAENALPARKAGIWETRVTVGKSTVSMRTCIDGTGDQLSNDFAGNSKFCREQTIIKTKVGYKTHHKCSIFGKTIENNMTIVGSFDKKLHTNTIILETDITKPNSKVEHKHSVDMTWIGPCKPNEVPLDKLINDLKNNLQISPK